MMVCPPRPIVDDVWGITNQYTQNYLLNFTSNAPRNFAFFRPLSDNTTSVPETATSSKASVPRSLSRAASTGTSTSTSAKKEPRFLKPLASSKAKREQSSAPGRPPLIIYEPSIVSSSRSKTPADSPVDSDDGSVYSFAPGEENGRGEGWADPELALRDPRAIVPVDLNERESQFFNVPLPTGMSSSPCDSSLFTAHACYPYRLGKLIGQRRAAPL